MTDNTLDDDLAADVSKLDDPDFVNVGIVINGKHRTLRFFRMDGLAWADICDRHPMRDDVPFDKNYGYNLRTATPDAARISGKLVNGDELTTLTDDQWATLFRTQSGAVIKRIGDALFNLNQMFPDLEVAQAKKASEDESKPNSSSPAESEFPAPV